MRRPWNASAPRQTARRPRQLAPHASARGGQLRYLGLFRFIDATRPGRRHFPWVLWQSIPRSAGTRPQYIAKPPLNRTERTTPCRTTRRTAMERNTNHGLAAPATTKRDRRLSTGRNASTGDSLCVRKIWFPQLQIAKLFGIQKAAISKHLKNIYAMVGPRGRHRRAGRENTKIPKLRKTGANPPARERASLATASPPSPGRTASPRSLGPRPRLRGWSCPRPCRRVRPSSRLH